MAQAATIGVTAAALILGGQPTLVPPAVCLVVGLHFLPLARLFDQPEFRWTGSGLCLVALVSGALHLWGSASVAVVAAGFGAAAVLWTTSLRVAFAG